MAAGSATIQDIRRTSAKRIRWQWTSDAGGNVNGNNSLLTYDGAIIAFATIPGTPTPTDLYDIVINDSSGFDMLFGAGANRLAASSQIVTTGLGVISGEIPLLIITNAGNATQGTVYLWIR